MAGAQPQKPPSPEAGEASSQAQRYQEDAKKWGTHLKGRACVPTSHPDNQRAATWKAGKIHSPISKPTSTSTNPFQPMVNMFRSWRKNAKNTARFKRKFNVSWKEKLKEAFPCYLSTSTGPVAGTLFLSSRRLAFLSDRPLCCTHDEFFGLPALGYYTETIQLQKVGTINPVIKRENNEPEKYIEIVSFADELDLWFMGFTNFEQVLKHLLNSLAEFRTAGNLGEPIVAA